MIFSVIQVENDEDDDDFQDTVEEFEPNDAHAILENFEEEEFDGDLIEDVDVHSNQDLEEIADPEVDNNIS